MSTLEAVMKTARAVERAIEKSSLKNSPISHLRGKIGRNSLKPDHVEQALLEHMQPNRHFLITRERLEPDVLEALQHHAQDLHGKLTANAADLSYGGMINESKLAVKNGWARVRHPFSKENRTLELAGNHAEAKAVGNREQAIHRVAGDIDGAANEMAEAAGNSFDDASDLVSYMESKDAAKAAAKAAKAEAKAAKAAKPMSFTKKAVLGGGAIAGGALVASNLASQGAANGGLMSEAESAGAQAAINDAMREGYGPVMMGAPMPQVQAANLNYQGPMIDGLQTARG